MFRLPFWCLLPDRTLALLGYLSRPEFMALAARLPDVQHLDLSGTSRCDEEGTGAAPLYAEAVCLEGVSDLRKMCFVGSFGRFSPVYIYIYYL